jgi:hypothetical protein
MKDNTKSKKIIEVSEQFDGDLPLPPLADPVISEIFKNADLSGLAMRELINAVLTDSGDETIREVIEVTPQKIDPEAQGRSYRVAHFPRASARPENGTAKRAKRTEERNFSSALMLQQRLQTMKSLSLRCSSLVF